MHESLAQNYETGRNGLPGNGDAGSTSAWFVLASLSLYPVAPGSAAHEVGVAFYDRTEVVLNLVEQAATPFVIEVERADTGQSAVGGSLNGASLTVPLITHAQVVSGGKVGLSRGEEPGVWDR